MRVSRSKIRKMIKEDFAQNEMNQRLSSQITMTLDDLIKVVIIASNAVLDNINYGDDICENQKEKGLHRHPQSPKQYSYLHTSPLVGEVSHYYWIHPQLTINHISKASTMFWGYNDTSSQFENYINTFASR